MARYTKTEFKRVPALDKCFAILELVAGSSEPLGISGISKRLDLNKSSVFSLVHTLADLGVLEFRRDGKLDFGTRLYLLGQRAGRRSELIRTVHPFLEEVTRSSQFSTFFGVRYGLRNIIVDKVDAPSDIRVSSEVGMRLPLFAGGGGKALLSQLSDAELDDILAQNELKRFTPYTCVDKEKFRAEVKKVREGGIAFDREEYIQGLVALAVPLNAHRKDFQAAIWAVGLKAQASNGKLLKLSRLLRSVAKEVEIRLSNG